MPNIFTNNPVCERGITFLYEGKKYAYNFKYNDEKEEYIYDKFIEIEKDQYGTSERLHDF